MDNNKPQFKYPKKNLLIGILFTIAGCLFMISTLGGHALTPTFFTVIMTLSGALLLYISIVKEKRSIVSVPGMMMTLGGVFYLLVIITPFFPDTAMKSIWPIFMMIAGISFIPYGLHSNSKKHKTVILIPAAAIIFLSILFLPFSLGLIKESFIDVVKAWWPSILILVGIVFILSSFREKGKKEKKKKKKKKKDENKEASTEA